MPNRNKGVLLIVLAALAWSTAGFFTHLIMADAWTILFWRSVFGCVFVVIFLLVTKGPASLLALTTMRAPGWLITLASTAGMLAFIPALRLTSVASVAVIYASMPIVAVVLSWLCLGERIQWRTSLAGLVVMLGATLVVGSAASSQSGLSGDLLAFVMTLAMAAMTLGLRRYPEVPVFAIVAMSNLLGAVAAFPLGHPLNMTAGDFASLAMFGLVQMALGLMFFTVGARYLPPAETALLGTIETPLAPLWVWIAFGDAPNWQTIAGGMMIVSAVMIYLWLDRGRGDVPKVRDVTADSLGFSGQVRQSYQP